MLDEIAEYHGVTRSAILHYLIMVYLNVNGKDNG